MSNAACLVANNSPRPAGSDTGYDPESDMVGLAPMAVPVYWLALFDGSKVVTFTDEGDDGQSLVIPSLVSTLAAARRLLRGRRGLLLDRFPEFRPTLDRFAECMDGLKRRYIKIDLEEMWDIDPDSFRPQLDAALRWFDAGGEDGFADLLELASIAWYDRVSRGFPGTAGVPRAFHLRGYPASLANWDLRSDL